MSKRLPEKLLGDGRRALAVGVAEIIARGWRGSADGTQRPRVQPQRVTHVIEADGVSKLRIHQGHRLTPIGEGARLRRIRVVAHDGAE